MTTLHTICSECRCVIVEGDRTGPTSHGLCQPCAAAWLEDAGCRVPTELQEPTPKTFANRPSGLYDDLENARAERENPDAILAGINDVYDEAAEWGFTEADIRAPMDSAEIPY